MNLEEARCRSLEALGVAPAGAARLLGEEEAPKWDSLRNLFRRLFHPGSR